MDRLYCNRILSLSQPTWLNLVPPLVSFLSSNPAVKSSHLESVQAVTGGAAPFGPALIEKFMEKAAPNVIKFREGLENHHFRTESIPSSVENLIIKYFRFFQALA